MYADPKHIRDREVKVRLDDASFDLLEAMAAFSRRQRAVLARELIEHVSWRCERWGGAEMTAVYPFSAVALFLGAGHCADADRDGVGFACFICSIVMFCAGVATFGGCK